ncbi:MAG: SEC-C metal-binding domain-containing protein, partial [Akkermansiaceae bacterium]
EHETLNNLFRSTTNLEQFENFMRSLPQQLTSDATAQAAAAGPAGALTQDNIARTGNTSNLAMTPSEDGQQIKLNLPKRKPALASVGRNDACPCGSGKKYKKCCGREA